MSMLTAKSITSEEALRKAKKVIASVQASKLVNQDLDTLADLRTVCASLEAARSLLKDDFSKSSLRDETILRLDKVYNSTVSMVDLVSRDEVDRKEAAAYLSKAATRASKLIKNYKALVEAKHKKATKTKKDLEQAAGAFDYYNTKDYHDDKPGKVDTVIELINKSGDVISEYQKYARQLPATEADSLKMGDFIMQRMPIVAMTDPIATPQDFEKGGFTIKPIGFYSVLENQLVLGIHANRLKAKKVDPETFKTYVIEKLQRELNKKLIVIGKPMGYKTSGYIYYWLVPEQNVDRFRTRAHKPLTVKQWHFAFKG